jgi:hypothetical protein
MDTPIRVSSIWYIFHGYFGSEGAAVVLSTRLGTAELAEHRWYIPFRYGQKHRCRARDLIDKQSIDNLVVNQNYGMWIVTQLRA